MADIALPLEKGGSVANDEWMVGMTRKRLISSRFTPQTFHLSPSPVYDEVCRDINSEPFYGCQVLCGFVFGSQVHSGWKPHTLKTPENTVRGHENGGMTGRAGVSAESV